MAVTGQDSITPNTGGPVFSADRDPGEVTREMSVGPLLARANLLRMRGQWEEAIAVCTEALRQAPRSPTAHSVIGDIYEAQGKFDDALQWYGMAVDLAPDRTSDREKLERIVAVQRTRLREQDSSRAASMDAHRSQMAGKLATSAASSTSGTGGRAAAERTVAWFDRVFPPGRSESIARLIFALCGIIAVLIATAFVFVYTSSSHTRTASSMITEGGTSASGLPSLSEPSPPVMVAVPSSAAAISTHVAPSHKPQASPSPGVAATPRASATETPTLLSQMSQSLPPGVSVTALEGDGGVTNPYRLEIALPKAVSETPSATQERFLRGAALAARALALLDNRSSQIIVRASLRDEVIAAGGALSGSTLRDILVFQASVSASAIRAIDPALTPTAALQAQFMDILWSPVLHPESIPAASTVPAVPLASAAAGVPSR